MRAAKTLTALVLLAGGCAGAPGPARTEAAASAAAQDYAQQMAGLVKGVAVEQQSATGGCAGGAVSVRNDYLVPVTEELDKVPLARYRTVWKANGLPVTERGVADGRTGMIGTVTPDGYHVTVTRSAPTAALAMSVSSPCLPKP